MTRNNTTTERSRTARLATIALALVATAAIAAVALTGGAVAEQVHEEAVEVTDEENETVAVDVVFSADAENTNASIELLNTSSAENAGNMTVVDDRTVEGVQGETSSVEFAPDEAMNYTVTVDANGSASDVADVVVEVGEFEADGGGGGWGALDLTSSWNGIPLWLWLVAVVGGLYYANREGWI